jgi:CheY-like chemotaxis protein
MPMRFIVAGLIGKGCEFTIKLPLEDAETVASDENESKPKAGAKRLRILVVDDNLDAQATLALYLGLQGNEVHTATDGLKAIAIAKSKRPQLIILDIGLPEMNGYDVCREIRQQSWGKRIVIVALSGWGQKEDKEKAIASGFDVHFTKPLDPAVLEDFLERQKDKLLDLS